MNSNIYDRKKHSYKNRPYYCPINNMWFYPYMYMNPYTSYMVNPFMTQYMDPYINSHMTNPSCYGNMCSCNERSQCEASGAYVENNYNFKALILKLNYRCPQLDAHILKKNFRDIRTIRQSYSRVSSETQLNIKSHTISFFSMGSTNKIYINSQ